MTKRIVAPLVVSLAFAAAATVLFLEMPAHGGGLGRSVSGNDFDLSFSLIPRNRIVSGGVSIDGIPSLDSPVFIRPVDAAFLGSNELVAGVKISRDARAYPLKILESHEIVSDSLGGVPIVVTYCPLCWSVLAFDRRVGGETRSFGVSGKLWNSNVLMYDRQRDWRKRSLWSQVQMRAVTGPAARAGLRLRPLPVEITTWGDWLERHPGTGVLSESTGFRRDYNHCHYAGYFASDRMMYPVRLQQKKPARFLKKEPMVVVYVGGAAKAYAFRDIVAVAGVGGTIEDVLGGARLRLTHVPEGDTVRVERLDGNGSNFATASMFWFALSAMLPKIEVYELPEGVAPNRRAPQTTSRFAVCSVCRGAGCSACGR